MVFGEDEREARELGSMEVLEKEGIRMRFLPIQSEGGCGLLWLGGGANRGRWSERGDWPGAEIEEKVGGGARVGSLEIRWFV